MSDSKPVKPKAERVKEAINILKKLKELGIADTDPGYKETKEHLDTWIQGGDTWVGKILFERYGRRAELVLPTREGRIASMKLMAYK
jgi:hypothetical protein